MEGIENNEGPSSKTRGCKKNYNKKKIELHEFVDLHESFYEEELEAAKTLKKLYVYHPFPALLLSFLG